MEELQIYEIVNDVTAQALGRTDLKVTTEQGLISLGRTVLDSNTYADDFLNTLVKRIGKTISSFRAYQNTFNSLMKSTLEWGAIVQKLKVVMPKAEEDESYNLTDGGSIDHYKIAKPEAKQKLFITDTPYQFHITIQRVHLEEAFTSANAMGSFLSAIYGEVQNAIEVALENLGRNCVCNRIAETTGDRVINLRTLFNAETGKNLATANECFHDPDFLRFAVAMIKTYSKKMRSMNSLFNEEAYDRHTPLVDQRLYVISDFQTRLETVVEYAAFNESYVKLNGFEEVAFWQALKTPYNVKVARASDNVETTVNNVVAVLGDRDGLGVYDQKQWTSTTPMNAAGGYYNTYWHEKQLWFNDLSEQFLVFTLN